MKKYHFGTVRKKKNSTRLKRSASLSDFKEISLIGKKFPNFKCQKFLKRKGYILLCLFGWVWIKHLRFKKTEQAISPPGAANLTCEGWKTDSPNYRSSLSHKFVIFNFSIKIKLIFFHWRRFYFQDETNIYFVYDYVHGGELFTRIRENKYFPNDVALFYACETFLALQYLHSKNILYRDLKPENLLLDKYGHIKLIDFGFAKILKPSERTFTLCGTPEYMAPEVMEKTNGYGIAADYWALGILIYEMLVG